MVHWYPWIGDWSDGSNLTALVAEKLPQMIEGSTSGMDYGGNAGLRDSLMQHGIPDAEIMVTEFNFFGSLQTSIMDEARSLFVADAYATWLEHGVSSVQYLELMGTPERQGLPDGRLGPRPGGSVLRGFDGRQAHAAGRVDRRGQLRRVIGPCSCRAAGRRRGPHHAHEP